MKIDIHALVEPRVMQVTHGELRPMSEVRMVEVVCMAASRSGSIALDRDKGSTYFYDLRKAAASARRSSKVTGVRLHWRQIDGHGSLGVLAVEISRLQFLAVLDHLYPRDEAKRLSEVRVDTYRKSGQTRIVGDSSFADRLIREGAL